MFFKRALVALTAVLSATPLAAATHLASKNPVIDLGVPLNHTANAAVLANLQARAAGNALGKRDDTWFLGIRSWTFTACGPNNMNCFTEHTETDVAWGGCIGGRCDAVSVSLSLDDKGGCDREINICGKTVKLAYSGDEFSCKPAKDIPRNRDNLGYAYVQENGNTIGACAVNWSRSGDNCIASAAYGFEARFNCYF